MKCVRAPQQPCEHSTGVVGPLNIIGAREPTRRHTMVVVSMQLLAGAETAMLLVVALLVVASMLVVVAMLIVVAALIVAAAAGAKAGVTFGPRGEAMLMLLLLIAVVELVVLVRGFGEANMLDWFSLEAPTSHGLALAASAVLVAGKDGGLNGFTAPRGNAKLIGRAMARSEHRHAHMQRRNLAP